VTKGYDLTTAFKHWNFPSKFFYGTYKSTTCFTDDRKKKIGCFGFVTDVIRPWETA